MTVQPTIEYTLHRTQGQLPCLIFENGLGATMNKAWGKLLPGLDPQQAYFTYNRPGYGRSPASTTPRDGTQIVAELRNLLRHLEVQPPYVLIGHSLGGLYMQLFARLHPTEVAALLLIDPTHPRQFVGIGALTQRPWWFRCGFDIFLRLKGGQSGREELAAAMKTGEQVLAAPPCPAALPVYILQSTGDAPATQTPLAQHSLALKTDFLQLYPGCQLSWVRAGHNIQDEQPELVLHMLQAALKTTQRKRKRGD